MLRARGPAPTDWFPFTFVFMTTLSGSRRGAGASQMGEGSRTSGSSVSNVGLGALHKGTSAEL